jgi:hypothetical protein
MDETCSGTNYFWGGDEYIDDMLDACNWQLVAEGGLPDPGMAPPADMRWDFLQPQPECRDLIDHTVPWDIEFYQDDPGHEQARAGVVDALYLLWFAPVGLDPEGIFNGEFDYPPGVMEDFEYYWDDVPGGEGFSSESYETANRGLIRRFWEEVGIVHYSSAYPSQEVVARYSGGELTVFHTYVDTGVDEDGLVDWVPDGTRSMAASVLLHEAEHGRGEEWGHESSGCSFVEPDGQSGCDADLGASAYAMEVVYLDGLVHGVLEASLEIGVDLVDDERLEAALNRACTAANRVNDWDFQQGGCTSYGSGTLDAYKARHEAP